MAKEKVESLELIYKDVNDSDNRLELTGADVPYAFAWTGDFLSLLVEEISNYPRHPTTPPSFNLSYTAVLPNSSVTANSLAEAITKITNENRHPTYSIITHEKDQHGKITFAIKIYSTHSNEPLQDRWIEPLALTFQYEPRTNPMPMHGYKTVYNQEDLLSFIKTGTGYITDEVDGFIISTKGSSSFDYFEFLKQRYNPPRRGLNLEAQRTIAKYRRRYQRPIPNPVMSHPIQNNPPGPMTGDDLEVLFNLKTNKFGHANWEEPVLFKSGRCKVQDLIETDEEGTISF